MFRLKLSEGRGEIKREEDRRRETDDVEDDSFFFFVFHGHDDASLTMY
jgi:hypothetical protein